LNRLVGGADFVVAAKKATEAIKNCEGAFSGPHLDSDFLSSAFCDQSDRWAKPLLLAEPKGKCWPKTSFVYGIGKLSRNYTFFSRAIWTGSGGGFARLGHALKKWTV
jgi:hypothetical protein